MNKRVYSALIKVAAAGEKSKNNQPIPQAYMDQRLNHFNSNFADAGDAGSMYHPGMYVDVNKATIGDLPKLRQAQARSYVEQEGLRPDSAEGRQLFNYLMNRGKGNWQQFQTKKPAPRISIPKIKGLQPSFIKSMGDLMVNNGNTNKTGNLA